MKRCSVPMMLLSILLSLCVTTSYAEWNTKDFFKREHSLLKPYLGTGTTIPYWDYVGSTMVTTNYVRLTSDDQSRQGGLWNIIPCSLRHWELQIQFKIHGAGKDLFGDGMAIWYAKDKNQLGPVFGSKDYFMGLAIFLDTYSNHNGEHNHQHPYLSAMVNNGTLHYDHDRDGTHTQLAGCEAKIRNLNHDTHIAIRYEYDTITVFTDFENKKAWKQCLSVSGVRLPTGYYFGVSAATGDLTDNHDIVGVRVYELESEIRDAEDRSHILPEAKSFEPPREHVDDPKSSWSGIKWFFVLIFGSLVLVVLGIFGAFMFQKHQEKSRKRFY